jgi:ABC-type branched-subunit amino acid transport system substrate-binding protein
MEQELLRINRYGKSIIVGLLVAIIAIGCSKATIGNQSVGVLTGDLTSGDSKNTETLASEQQIGYELGLKNGNSGFKLVQKTEGDLEDDVQTAIRDMVEGNQIVALLGGTSNEATMRAASLTNFFNVPMVIPNADGENVIPSNNLWVFRLSAPSSAYAKYIFTEVIQKASPTETGTNTLDSSSSQSGTLKLAIIYEKNTFGENAAVSSAQISMDQSIKIVFYGSFTTGEDNAQEIISLAQTVNESGANLVYVISDNPDEAISITKTLKDAFGSGLAPIILGQGSGFDSQTFLNSDNATGVYVIRQAINSTDCPAEINTISKARSYASIFLLKDAVSQANKNIISSKLFSNFSNKNGNQISEQREKIRDSLKQTDMSVPCLGPVSFDNNGLNKVFSFEFLQVEKDKPTTVTADQFRTVVEQAVARDQLIIIENGN